MDSFDQIVFASWLSMPPDWRRALPMTLDHPMVDGSVHVVDFRRQDRLHGFVRDRLGACRACVDVSQAPRSAASDVDHGTATRPPVDATDLVQRARNMGSPNRNRGSGNAASRVAGFSPTRIRRPARCGSGRRRHDCPAPCASGRHARRPCACRHRCRAPRPGRATGPCSRRGRAFP